MALNLFTSFGYFSDDENLQVLDHLQDSVVPGGTVVIDVAGKELVAQHWKGRWWSQAGDTSCSGGAHRDGRLEPARVTRLVYAGNQRHECRGTQRLFSGGELAALLQEAGFGEVRLYGGFDGAPYDREATRLVAVARA